MIKRAAVAALVLLGLGLPVAPVAGLLIGPPSAGFSNAPGDLGEGLQLLLTTLALALVVSGAAAFAGTWLAWVEQRSSYRGVRLLGVLSLMPLAVPSYILAGTLRHTLGPGGIGRVPFTGFWPAALTLTLATIPYVQLLVSAALARVPSADEEAARTLGADGWRAFRVAVLPRLRPSIAFSTLLVQLYVISDFGAVAMLDCPVLTWRLYRAVDTQQFGRALVLGGLVLVATLPLLIAARAVHGRESADRGAVANPRPPERRPLATVYLGGTLTLQVVLIGLGLLVPIVTLVSWVARADGDASLAGPLYDTATIALAGGSITMLLAWTPAWVAAHTTRRRSWWIEQATFLTSALPGVLLAFGLLLFTLFLSRAAGAELYYAITSSGVLLMAGYATRFFAEAFSGLKTAALAVDPRQIDSARVLGASFIARGTRVIAPAVLPGAAAASVLVVVAIMKELPVTLLLGGATGLRTLSFRMYDRYQDAFLADAGAAGLVLLGLALMALTVSLRWRHHV